MSISRAVHHQRSCLHAMRHCGLLVSFVALLDLVDEIGLDFKNHC
jgi:hypothetical protein